MRNKSILIIIGLLFLAVFLRSLNLSRGYFGDEAVTLKSASANFLNIIPELKRYDAHPPLTSLLLHFWMLISSNEIFIRFYCILFGIGVLLITCLIAYEYLNHNTKFALLVLFLGALSPMLISMSQFIRNYTDSAFWLLFSSYFLLLILRGKGTKGAWAGYFIASLLSIYTFYFSAVIILSQSLYVIIFKFRQRQLIKKWILTQLGVVLLFSPCLPIFFTQIHNASAKNLYWMNFGFKFAGLDLGTYSRNISALFGLDHFFMVFSEGIVNRFGVLTLLFMAAWVFLLFFLFIYLCLKWLKEEFKTEPFLAWYLIFLSLPPLIFSWVGAKLITKTLPNARYLVAPHAISLILISYFIFKLILAYRKIGIFFLSALTILYCWRIPMAITPEYEGKRVLEYLKAHAEKGDCIVLVDFLPGVENLSVPSIKIADYLFERGFAISQYRALPESRAGKIKLSLKPFKRIWFVRDSGNPEILGGNKIAYDFLIGCGRKQTAVREFHNVKLILLE